MLLAAIVAVVGVAVAGAVGVIIGGSFNSFVINDTAARLVILLLTITFVLTLTSP